MGSQLSTRDSEDGTVTVVPGRVVPPQRPRKPFTHAEKAAAAYRSTIQFYSMAPFWAGILMGLTQAYATWIWVGMILFGIGCMVWAYMDYDRINDGDLSTLMRELGMTLLQVVLAVILVLWLRRVWHGITGHHHHHHH